MLKFLSATFLSSLLFYSIGLFLPWWGSFVVGILVGLLIHQNYFLSFLSVFMGVFLVGLVYIFYISVQNDHILAKRISLMIIKEESPVLLIIISSLISALCAGISAITGRSFYLFFKK
jgi:hypothetical protein